LSTVERADRIIVIGNGMVLEQGTHAELLRRTDIGVYAKLVQRQMLGFEIGITDDPALMPPACGILCSSSLTRGDASMRSSSLTIVPRPYSLSRRHSDAGTEAEGFNHDASSGSLKFDTTA